jgi:hypothetical protein
MSVKKRVLPNYVDKKLQICKMSKLHIFVITNICNEIFVIFGRIGTWTVDQEGVVEYDEVVIHETHLVTLKAERLHA